MLHSNQICYFTIAFNVVVELWHCSLGIEYPCGLQFTQQWCL